MNYFVWLKGQRGPYPQLWAEDRRNFKERPNKEDVIEFHELPQSMQQCGIAYLSVAFPLKQQS